MLPDKRGMTTSHPLDVLIWDERLWVPAFLTLLDRVEEELEREDEEQERAEWDEDNDGDRYE